MFVFKAAVVGAGVMGGEIAQVVAAADIPVLLKDVDAEFVEAGLRKAREVTEGQVGRLVAKEKLTQEQGAEQVERTLSLITGTTDYDGFGDVDFVIEAVPERIEVVEGEDTSQATLQAAANFAQAIRKTPVRCAECPGFVVNRILTSTASEIWRYQDETGTSPEELDAHIKEAAGMPMGPFRVADMSGLDTVAKVARDMRDAYGDRFYVHKGMEELVERGDLGAKTGKGFYEH